GTTSLMELCSAADSAAARVGDSLVGEVEVEAEAGAQAAGAVGWAERAASISDSGTPPSRNRLAITSTWVAWTAPSRRVTELGAPPTALGQHGNHQVRPQTAH